MKKILLTILIIMLIAVPAGAAGFQFALSTDSLYVNGVQLDKPLYAFEGSNYLPLRAVAESLGAKVGYNNGRIDISKPKYSAKDAVVLADMANSVLLIKTNNMLGSGFAAGDGSLIVTNYHVVENAIKNKTEIKGKNHLENKYYTLEVKDYDTVQDIAILKVAGRVNYIPLKLGDSDKVAVGDGVITISHTNGYEACDWEAGEVIETDIMIESKHTIITSAHIWNGSSGGVLLNENGEVIGLIYGADEAKDVSAILPINIVKEMLNPPSIFDLFR